MSDVSHLTIFDKVLYEKVLQTSQINGIYIIMLNDLIRLQELKND